MSQPTATTPDLETVTERYFAAWEARDPDAIAALHTEDTQFWAHLGGEPVHGRAAARDAFAELFERFPGFGFETYRVLLGDEHWVLDWKLTFEGPDGETRGFDCLDAVVVSADGLVARKDTFVDMVQLQAALPQLDVEAERGGSAVSG
jgi:ketosteroid isomerase-like protein